MNHPLALVLLIAAGWYAGKLWWHDWRAARNGTGNAQALPGAADAPRRIVVIGVAGAIGCVAVETAGEQFLGIASGQSRMTWLFALYSITSAPILEELIFRGWLVVENRGRATMWAAAAGASLLFALLHPFLWAWGSAGFAVTLTLKGWFSTGMAFVTSLGLYALRLGSWNPQRSLLPCFVAHAAKNLAVVLVKASTGFMAGPW